MNTISNIRSQQTIHDLAKQWGWIKDRSKSSAAVSVLRDEQGGKILVMMGKVGYEIFRDERNPANRGDVLDFAQWIWRCDLREAMTRLGHERPSFPSGKRTSLNPSASGGDVDPYRKTQAVWTAARSTANNAYLQARGLSEATLNDPRFKDRHRLTTKGATIFPHFDRSGMCGYEVRGVNVRSFGKGTRKGLWYSNDLVKAPAIVVCESVIDCMSHAQLNSSLDYGYASFAGEIGNAQRDLLTSLLHKAAQRDVRVIVATDNDAKGEDYFEALSLLSPCSLARWTPTCKDWNCDLIQSLKAQ